MEIKEKGQFANMPQDVKIKQWPKHPGSSTSDLNDTITGIDSCISKGVSKKKSHISNQK